MKPRQTHLMKRINSMNRTTIKADKMAQITGRSKYKGVKNKLQRMCKSFVRDYLGVYLAGLLAVSMVSCDGHKDFPDTSMKIGEVVCTDGKVLTVAEANAQGKEPIAVVFYVNTSDADEGIGYAVYLNDIQPKALTDSIGISQGTSADITALDGNSNTFALYANTSCGSPAAQAVFDMWKYGQSAYIPSIAQMRLLYLAKESINPIIKSLGGDVLPYESDDVWYWTSTEVANQQTAKAWLYSLGSGAMQETPKDQAHKVRPIITINQ